MRVGIAFESEAASYIEDGLLRGFTELLGYGSVWAWPGKEHHHPARRSPMAPEATCGSPFGPPRLLTPAIVPTLNLLVVGNPSNNSEHLGLTYNLVEAAQRANVHMVGLEGGDVARMAQLEALLPGRMWFVREPPSSAPANVAPITFTVEADGPHQGGLPWSERTIDVLWAGSTNYAGRAKFTDALKAWSSPYVVEVIESRSLTYADWCTRLDHARVCIDLRGAGTQTYRYFEGAASGCAVLAQGPVNFCRDLPLHLSTFETPDQMLAEITRVLDFPDQSRILRDVTLRQLRARTRYSFEAQAADFLTRAFGA